MEIKVPIVVVGFREAPIYMLANTCDRIWASMVLLTLQYSATSIFGYSWGVGDLRRCFSFFSFCRFY